MTESINLATRDFISSFANLKNQNEVCAIFHSSFYFGSFPRCFLSYLNNEREAMEMVTQEAEETE